jgi:hypothetical protein
MGGWPARIFESIEKIRNTMMKSTKLQIGHDPPLPSHEDFGGRDVLMQGSHATGSCLATSNEESDVGTDKYVDRV